MAKGRAKGRAVRDRALQALLRQRCGDAVFENADIKKLVDAGYVTASLLAKASLEDFQQVLPGRRALWDRLLASFAPTVKEFLQQELETPRFKFFFDRPPSRPAFSASQLVVRGWKGVRREISKYLDTQSERAQPKQVSLSFNFVKEGNEIDLQGVMVSLLFSTGTMIFGARSLFQVCQGRNQRLITSQRGPGEDVESSDASGYASELADAAPKVCDILCYLGDKPLIIGEMKVPVAFRPGEGTDAFELTSEFNKSDHQSGVKAAVCALQQLYVYLKRFGVEFGFLSSLDVTYIVKRQGDTLLVSRPIGWESGDLLPALAYILAMAAESPVPPHGGSSSGLPALRDVRPDDTQGKGKESKDDDGGRKRGRAAATEPQNALGDMPSSSRRSKRGKRHQGWQETAAKDLHLRRDFLVGEGWSGFIARGTYEGHPVAVKLAPVGSGRAKALQDEVIAYYKLEKYWGKHVPILRSFGTTSHGSVVYLATELIEGFPLGTEAVTNSVVEALFAALHAIHSSGILHGDIRKDNIMVPKGGQSGVRFIDFGFAHVIVDSKDCKREQKELQLIIDRYFFVPKSEPVN